MTISAPENSVSEEIIAKLSEKKPENEGYRSVLKNSNFLWLWIGQIFSQLGDRVVFVVFITMIASYFGSNDSYNSYLYIAFTIPAILLTAVAGVFVDRWPRRAVLVSTNIFRALFMAFLPWAAGHSLMAIYTMAFLLSSATQFFVPAEAATIPTLVRKTQLMAANSLFTTTMMASVIFGFALGDPLINILGIDEVHWSIVGLFVLASAVLMLVKVPETVSIKAHDDELKNRTVKDSVQSFFAELAEGIDFIKQNPLVLSAMLKLALLFSTVVAMCILFISFAKVYLYPNPAVAARKFAYIVTFSGIGMALGAFLVGRYFRNSKRSRLVFGGFSLTGACLTALTFTGLIDAQALWLHLDATQLHWVYFDTFDVTVRMIYTYTLSVLMGIGAGFVAIPLQALLHELIPEDKRGKVMGVQFTILSTSSTLPVLAAGLGVEFIGVQWMLYLIGLPMLALGLWGLNRYLRTPDGIAENW